MIELFQKPQESSLKRTTNFQNLRSQADDMWLPISERNNENIAHSNLLARR